MERITIENYLKTIYHLSEGNKWMVSNKQMAEHLKVIPATVTEAIKKLAALDFVEYEKSYGSKLTSKGHRLAVHVIRRHRLWETFLEKELGFSWDEVHEIAEDLEHVDNQKLIDRLDKKLGNPGFDPHGDPIPNHKGKFNKNNNKLLSEVLLTGAYTIVGVKDHSAEFLKYCEKSGLRIGQEIMIVEIETFDGTLMLKVNKKPVTISAKTAGLLIVHQAKSAIR